MIETGMERRGEKIDLSLWGLGNSDIEKAIVKSMEEMLDVFFSEDGVEISMMLTFHNNELALQVDIDIDGVSAYMTKTLSIMELLREEARFIIDDYGLYIAPELRRIADLLEGKK